MAGVLTVAAVVCIGLSGVAGAERAPRRTPAAQTRNPVKAPKKVAARRVTKPPPAPTETAVLVQYQRIGRDLIQLQEFRGTDCTLDLWPSFRAIRLAEATATPEARIAAAATLHELQRRITRKRGITIRQECLDNPLAAECL